MKEFSPFRESFQTDEHFAPNINDLVNQSNMEAFNAISRMSRMSLAKKNHYIVANLEEHGIFNIKGAVEVVAEQLGITKHTIYKYLREIRKNSKNYIA